MSMDEFRILIVDDNENNVFILIEILDELKYCDIHSALSAREALKCLLEFDVDLLILDINLPDMDGYELARLVKSHKKTMDIPIIFCTAFYKTDQSISRGFELGAIDYLLKPINEEQFINKIKYYIKIHQKQQELTDQLKCSNLELLHQNYELNEIKLRLERSEILWRSLGENVPDIIILVNRDTEIVFLNRTILSDPDPENREIGNLLINLIIYEHQQLFRNMIEKCFISRKTIDCEVCNLFPQDKERWSLVRVVAMNGSVSTGQIMLIIKDITQRKKSEEEIRYLNGHDKLTNLFNRNYIEQQWSCIDTIMQLPLSIVIADMNGLKLVNDAFGYQKGDQLLKETAAILRESCREQDIVARWGGDEFIILMSQTSEEIANGIVEKILSKIELLSSDNLLHAHLAWGIATRTSIDQDSTDIIRQAENRMYRNKLRDTQSFRSSVIESLKKTLREKDYETEAHTQRIEKMALQMAKVLNLSSSNCDNLSLLATLHDIGKVAISDGILLKPGRLTGEEFEIIKTHSEIGYRICRTIPELISVADMILSHHEWWNGEGYPQGLAQEKIPLLSRVLSILDAYDVMTHVRPYKEPYTHEYAIQEIKRCAGAQFDPQLVELFCSLDYNYIE